MKPKSAKWLKTQYATIGGSSAATVIGKNPFHTRRDLAAIMREERPYPDLSENDDVLRGYYCEPVARKILAHRLGEKCHRHPQDAFIRNPQYPFAHCLVDGWLGDRGGMPVEIKWPRAPKFCRIVMTGTPEEYWIQVQHECAVAKSAAVVLGIFCADRLSSPIIQTIERDQKFIDELMDEEREFNRAVLTGQRFDDEDKAKIGAAIAIPTFDGETKVLSGNETAARMAREYLEARQLVKDAQEIETSAKARLVSELDESSACWDVRDGEETIVRARRSPGVASSSVDKAGARAAYPDFDRFVKTKTGDPFWTIYAMKQNRGGW